MSRIAEFESATDAMSFMRWKGEDAYTVVGGLHYTYAVMPKPSYMVGLGDPFSPPESVIQSSIDPDLDSGD